MVTFFFLPFYPAKRIIGILDFTLISSAQRMLLSLLRSSVGTYLWMKRVFSSSCWILSMIIYIQDVHLIYILIWSYCANSISYKHWLFNFFNIKNYLSLSDIPIHCSQLLRSKFIMGARLIIFYVASQTQIDVKSWCLIIYITIKLKVVYDWV